MQIAFPIKKQTMHNRMAQKLGVVSSSSVSLPQRPVSVKNVHHITGQSKYFGAAWVLMRFYIMSKPFLCLLVRGRFYDVRIRTSSDKANSNFQTFVWHMSNKWQYFIYLAYWVYDWSHNNHQLYRPGVANLMWRIGYLQVVRCILLMTKK